MNNLPYVPTEYNTNPGIKKLGDEPHFIIDGLYPTYRNEIMDARTEDLGKYYIEKPSVRGMHNKQEVTATHNFLMKTIPFGWLIFCPKNIRRWSLNWIMNFMFFIMNLQGSLHGLMKS